MKPRPIIPLTAAFFLTLASAQAPDPASFVDPFIIPVPSQRLRHSNRMARSTLLRRLCLVLVVMLVLCSYALFSVVNREPRNISHRGSSDPTRAHLLSLLVDVASADGVVYGATDSQGRTMDTAKVIQTPEGDYLAVYHTLRADGRFHAAIATSTDLLHFTFVADFGAGSSQPTLFSVGDGSYVMAWEQDPNNHIAVRYFSNRASLLAAEPTRSFDTPMTLSSCAEGTPNIYSVQLNPDIDHSFIDIGGHYFRNCQVDRQQRGNLTNLNHWVTSPRPDVDNAILFWGVQGNIGDRDAVALDGFEFQVIEGQGTLGDFGSWRTYLYDFSTGNADRANVVTAHGSTAFANPSISNINVDGQNAVMVGLFIPSEGAAPGEAGQLIYYRKY
ncbi:hypothetical protein B0H13DRAFT_719256 [Mycena leptocephala]|nr:hypothetical protein B0H13DRAFT_719256 [Mycena leptocephala]